MEDKKSMVFWVGLILLSLASVILFGVVWMVTVVMHPASRLEFLKGLVRDHRHMHDEVRDGKNNLKSRRPLNLDVDF